MNIKDYLIDQSGWDWEALLGGWAAILPDTFTIWLVNRFADVFLVAADGSVHLLDVAGGTFSRVAESRDQFADLMDVLQNANKWLMIPLVDQCVGSGMSLGPGQCYGFKIPPRLNGEYALSNIVTVDLARNYAFLADLWSQTKGMPDGTRVRLVIGPQPDKQ